jgi:tetratricopeptide (TPR) repeat protein
MELTATTSRNTQLPTSLDRPSPGGRVVRALGLVAVAVAGAVTLASCGTHAALTPTQLINRGLSAYNSGDYSQAIKDFKKVIQKDPTDKDGLTKIAWFDLGALEQKLGDTAVARADYQQVLLIDPKYVNALYNLGVLEASTDPTGAISLYRQALALAPKDPDILWNLGLLLYARPGERAQARIYLKETIKLDPAFASRLPKNVKL